MAFEMRPFNNSVFDLNPSDFFKDFSRNMLAESSQHMKTDITEREDDFLVEAELPGFDKENIKIDFNNDVLSITGEQSVNKEEKDDEGKVVHKERSVQNIRRQFAFDKIDSENINASFENGVLQITLPKTIQADKKSIEIK